MEVTGASVNMVLFPDVDFISKLASIPHSQKCMIIAYKVTNGLGRLGNGFTYQFYDAQPGMVVTAKALENGYPISTVTVNAQVHERNCNTSFKCTQSY